MYNVLQYIVSCPGEGISPERVRYKYFKSEAERGRGQMGSPQFLLLVHNLSVGLAIPGVASIESEVYTIWRGWG